LTTAWPPTARCWPSGHRSGLDPLIPGSGKQTFALCAAGQDLSHPYLSPLNGDFAPGFPPAILTTGTRDMLLSDTVLLHRAWGRESPPL